MWQDNVIETNPNKTYNLSKNPILEADSYKYVHNEVYPEGSTNNYSYVEPRVKGKVIVPFGLSMWVKDNLSQPITQDNILEAEDIINSHGETFNREGWEYILKEYGGYLPLKTRGIPEGMRVPSATAIASCVVTDTSGKLAWLSSFGETSFQRGIWYPTTIASQDYENYMTLKWFYDHGSDNPDALMFALHSFASRGVSSRETAMIGGIAHLLYFRGTDDVVALRGARKFYDCPMAGFSVRATEHSVQCSYGPSDADQDRYFQTIIDKWGRPGQIASVVMDGYDIYRETERLRKFKDQIIASGMKWVVRPDSGDMFEVVPRIFEILDSIFGHTVNSKGKKVLNNVAVIQGDGINHTTAGMLMQKVYDLGWAPENLVLGSGGGLLQKVDRDTYSFAQKTSAIEIDGKWIDVVKAPITDSGKKSKGGFQDSPDFVTYYENGKILYSPTLDEIRARATEGL